MPVNHSTKTLRQEDCHELQAILGYRLKLGLETKKKGRKEMEGKGREGKRKRKRKERLQENVLPHLFYYSQGCHMSKSPPRHET